MRERVFAFIINQFTHFCGEMSIIFSNYFWGNATEVAANVLEFKDMAFLRHIRAAVVGLGLAAVGFSFGQKADNLSVSYAPVWDGLGLGSEVVPVRLTLENTGKPEIVEVKWTAGENQISTFFEMPTGSKKERVIYLNQALYGGSEVRVRRGLVESNLSIELGSEGLGEEQRIGLVTDSVGLRTFLKSDRKNQFQGKNWQGGFLVAAVSPDNAPDRSVGYSEFDLLILGEGSERLSDSAVAAIQRAVLGGVNLVVPGGSIQPLLSDSRWEKFLPVKGSGQVGMVAASKEVFGQFSNSVPGATPMLRVTPKLLADVLGPKDAPVVARHSVGFGAVSFLAFDPFFPAWREWDGRYALFYELLLWQPRADVRMNMIGEDYGYVDQPSASVFGVEMPSSGRISLVLFAYFLLVVPVNFLVLRKLKRGELAWLTAPLIAVGAAGILFAFAGRLYSAEASRYSTGAWIGSDGSTTGQFEGSQQLFFPGTGAYDLGLQGVESIESSGWAERDMFGQVRSTNQFLDMDGVVAPRFEVSNLSFREFSFVQSKDSPGALADLRIEGSKVVGRITNRFESRIEGLQISVGAPQTDLGSLDPGQSVVVSVPIDLTQAKGLGIAIRGEINGAGFGSDFGKAVGEDGVKFYYSVLGVGE